MFNNPAAEVSGENRDIYLNASVPPITWIGINWQAKVIVRRITMITDINA